MLTRPGSGFAWSVIAGSGNSCAALIASARGSICGTGPVGANPVVSPGLPVVSKVHPPMENPPNVIGGRPGDVSVDMGPPGTMMFDPSSGRTGPGDVPGLDQPGTLTPGPLKYCGPFGSSWMT